MGEETSLFEALLEILQVGELGFNFGSGMRLLGLWRLGNGCCGGGQDCFYFLFEEVFEHS